jgi:polar amino acid transport system ATP-binding protein
MNSKLLLLDEPTSALDPQSSKKLVQILRILKAEGISIALSTHDMTFSKYLMDKVYFMENGHVIEELDVKTKNLEETIFIKKFFEN